MQGYCALNADAAPPLLAACNSKPGCTTVNLLLGASMGLRLAAGPVGATTGVLKAINGTVTLQQLCYSPFSALYLRQGQVASEQLPAVAAAAPLPPAAAPGSPQAQPAREEATWSILLRPQAELRPVGDGEQRQGAAPSMVCPGACLPLHMPPLSLVSSARSAPCHAWFSAGWAIAAPNVLLPGIAVSGQSNEPSFEACVRRCIQFPDCHSERGGRGGGGGTARGTRQPQAKVERRHSLQACLIAPHPMPRRDLLPTQRQRILHYRGVPRGPAACLRAGIMLRPACAWRTCMGATHALRMLTGGHPACRRRLALAEQLAPSACKARLGPPHTNWDAPPHHAMPRSLWV